MIPPRFEYSFYTKDKGWLTSETEAKQHFESVGVPNGLAGSHAADQGNFVGLISRLQPGNILEIGPGCAPKLRGNNVRYFDVKSATELRDRYRDDPGKNNIPKEIHFVSEEGNLNEVNEKFDIIFSSHMIEHSLDLIDHLNSVHSLLNPGGYYFVIAPNKLYTFDYFKPLSLAEDVIAHHVACDGKPRLAIRSILLEKFKRTHNDALRHWSGDHGSPDFDHDEISRVLDNLDAIRTNHVARSGFHSWIFTDESFETLMRDLEKMKMISLQLVSCYNTPYGSCSFNAVLKN